MTTPADLILTNTDIHTFAADASGEPDASAVAIRDGQVVRVDSSYEVGFLEDAGTTVLDLSGRTILPGFIDAHTHLDFLGQRELEADLSGAMGPEECLSSLREHRETTDGWVLGFNYDESTWDEQPDDGETYLTRDQLDEVSADRPVAAFREDMHLASVNSVTLESYREELPDEDVRTEDGRATGVLVEDAVGVIMEETRPDPPQLRDNLRTAQAYAHRHGVTAVHEMVKPDAARAYRDLDEAGELTLRVRLNYWAEHLDGVLEAGLATNHGSSRVRTGAIKSFVDGSLGGRTARLSEPYADREGHGDWVTPPEELSALVERVDDAGLQVMFHAIGDEAITAVLDAYEGTDGERHRIEHAEVLTDELIDRLAASEVVVSAQPNFLKWAEKEGLYESRLGDERRRDSNRFGALADAGANLAFGSDCMPLSPLDGIDWAVNAPGPAQQLDVGEAIQAYTAGSAYAGFDEDRLGTIEVGTCADFTVLSGSPWTDEISGLDVVVTVVDGVVVYDDR